MKRSLNLAAAAVACVTLPLISGCATTRYAPVHCITPEQFQKLKDAEPPKVGQKLTGQAQDDLKIIAGSNVELREYSHGLLGVIGGCVGG